MKALESIAAAKCKTATTAPRLTLASTTLVTLLSMPRLLVKDGSGRMIGGSLGLSETQLKPGGLQIKVGFVDVGEQPNFQGGGLVRDKIGCVMLPLPVDQVR